MAATRTRKRGSKRGGESASSSDGNGSTLDTPKMTPRTFPVHFGRLSIGTATLRIPFKLSTGAIGTQAARELLCERRLDVTLKNGDGQPRLDFDEQDDAVEVSGSADTKGLMVNGKHYASGLTFSRNDVDQERLIGLVESDGRLTIHDVSEIPDEAKPKRGRPPKEHDVDVEAGKHKPHGQPALETLAAARRDGAELAAIGIPDGSVKRLVTAGVRTVAELEDFGARGQLVAGVTKGLGQKAIDEILAAVERHRNSGEIIVQIPSSDKHSVTLTVKQTDTGRWQCGYAFAAPLLNGSESVDESKKHPSRKAAIEAAVGSLIDTWSQHGGAEWKAATDDLRTFLRGME